MAILLATYNGARHLPAFLDSLHRQTHRRWTLIWRDDGSSDNTRSLLADSSRSIAQTQALDDSEGNLGTLANFARLLERAQADYYMFADQDDVWEEDKIARGLAALQALELRHPPGTPALVFCDLRVTDAGLRTLQPSFMAMHGFMPAIRAGLPLRRLLVQNVAPGCSMIFNPPMRAAALPVPPEAAMHDWWMMLVARVCGAIEFLPAVGLSYRQHGGNQLGAPTLLDRLREMPHSGWSAYNDRQRKAQAQAGALLTRFQARLDPRERHACRTLSRIKSYPPLLRQWMAARVPLTKAGVLRNLVFYLVM